MSEPMKSNFNGSGLDRRRQARGSLHNNGLIGPGGIIAIDTKFSSINHVPASDSRFWLTVKSLIWSKEIRDF